MSVAVDVRDGVAIVTLENPPVNAVSPWVPGLLIETLAAQDADPAVHAIVLRGAGRCFSAGADIAAFDGPRDPDAPHLRDLLDAMDRVGKPLIASVHGLAYGGGLEIALAAHWRVAAPGTKFALPEIQLGLIPGAGGTQRLPRLIGAAKATAMMLDGRPTEGDGIVDVRGDADPTDVAVAFARNATVRRVRDLPVEAAPDAVAAAREQARKRPLRAEAFGAIASCVEASWSLPFEEGCAREYALFDALLRTDTSRGMRHAFAAERAVARVPGLPKSGPAIESAAVVGAGTMGTGIALALLGADLPVTLIEPREDARARAERTIGETLAAAEKRGRATAEQTAARLGRLRMADAIDACAQADLVIEAVFEDMAVKHDVFARIDAAAKPGAVLATNTSTLDVDAIAAGTGRPGDVVGLHFFSPANVMRLLEVVRGKATRPEVLACAMALAKRIGKVGVVAGVCDGFIGNRMFEEYLRQVYWLLEEGALPSQVDGAMERWGMALGPLRVMDLAGNDIGWSIRKRRAAERPGEPYSPLPDLICERGWFGQKTGRGWYLYPDGRRAVDDPEVEALIKTHATSQRPIGDAEIVERCVLALVNEGARLLADGIAMRPLDIDQVYVHGYGFPPERGGPMFHADLIGLPEVVARLDAFAAGPNGWSWTPAPLLRELVANGANLASLNKESRHD